MPRPPRLIGCACAAALLVAASAALAQPAAKPSSEPQDFLKAPPKPSTSKGAFTLVSIGDLLYSHPFADSSDPELQRVLTLVKSGDVAIANREGMFFDLKTFKGAGTDQGMLWSEAVLGRDMKAMGVDMVSMANNHSTDWGPEGLLESQHLLDEAGIAHAGSGRTLQEARRAGILTSPKGRIGLVSTASTLRPNTGANDPIGDVPGRTGISILRTRVVHLVTAGEFAQVKALATELATPLAPAPKSGAVEIELFDILYRLSPVQALHYDMDLYDEAGLLKSVREAKAACDLVVFTIHAHESPTGEDDDTPAPPDFLVKLFHEAVDAGADVIMGGGPHSLRGVEIYHGKPVLYGLGAFFINGEIKAIQQSQFNVWPDATGHAPPPAPEERSVRRGGNPASWYDGVVAVTEFQDGRPKRLKLYPLDLGNTYDRTRRGIPHFADPANAKRILHALRDGSRAFGTVIQIEGSIGVVRIP